MSEPHFGGPEPHPSAGVPEPHRRKPIHLSYTFSYHGYVTSTPMMDGQLLARPLVLDEVQPATLRASTSMSRQTKPSVMRPNDRCPPAASPRSSTPLRRSRGQLGALVPRQAPDLSSGRIQSPSHPRRLPPISINAHVGRPKRHRRSSGGRSPSIGGTVLGKSWTLAVTGGTTSRRSERTQRRPPHPRQPPTPEGDTLAQRHARARHARACNGHARASNGHARAETRSCTDTLAHGHARAITRISHDARLLPAAGLRPPR